MTRTPRSPRAARSDGFTLLEVIVVVAILGLVGRMIYVNLQGFIPESVMDAERSKLAAAIDQMRSEAAVNGKSYTIEFDITNDRWRYLVPPELRVASDQFISDDPEANAMNWTAIDDAVDLVGIGSVGNTILRNGLAQIVFNENGECADYVLYLRHAADENLVWTLVYRGLAGNVEMIDNTDGVEYRVQEVTEGAF